MADKPESNRPDQKKSTNIEDLPPNKDGQDAVKGGVGGRPIMDKPMCSSGLLSTCKVTDTTVNVCDTLSGCK